MASAGDADGTPPSAPPAPAGERAKSTADLDRVTDYVEETEVDTAALSASVAGLAPGAGGGGGGGGGAIPLPGRGSAQHQRQRHRTRHRVKVTRLVAEHHRQGQ